MNDDRADLIPPRLANHSGPTTNQNFTVSFLASLGLSNFLAPKLTLSSSIATYGPDSFGPDITKNDTSYFNALDVFGVFRDSDMDNLFQNLAKSMTRNIRDVSASNQTWSLDGFIGPLNGTGPANGVATREYIYISVQWLWLILSATLVLLTVLFLILTIIKTARHDVAVWKSSPLPLLFNGLDEDERECLRTAKGIVAMEELSSEIQVELKDDSRIGSGIRLVVSIYLLHVLCNTD